MSINNNGENGENGLEKNKKTSESLELKFRKDFIFESLKSKNQTDKNKFISDLMTNNTISGTNIEIELKEFYAKNQEEYNSIDLSKIDIYQLRNLVAKDFLKVENAKNDLKEKIFLDYEITDKFYDANLKQTIDGLSHIQLTDLYKSDKKLTEFLIKKNNLNKRNRFKVLNLINEKETAKRLNNIDQEYRNDVEQVLEKLSIKGNLSDSDLRLLFYSNFLKEDEKKEFISIFIPLITLERAIEIGLLTSEEANIKLKQINSKILKDAGVDDSQIEELTKKLSLSDIKIETKNINDIEQINKIAEIVGFNNLENDSKELTDEERQKIIKDGPKNLKELADGLQHFNRGGMRFSNLEKFIEGSIVEFSTKKSDGEEKKSYIKILSNNQDKRKFSYVSIGTQDGHIDLKNSGEIKEINYIDFLDKFQKNDVKLNFFTKKEIEMKIESGELKTAGIDFLNNDDLISDQEKRKNIENLYSENLENEIKNLEEKINNEGGEEKNTLLSAKLKEKQTELESIKNGNLNITNNILVNFSNFYSLLAKIDEIDPDGKKIISSDGRVGLFKGMFLKTNDNGIFEIIGIDNDKGIITLKNFEGKLENLDFNGFLEAFKKHETKRLSAINNFQELIDSKKLISKIGGNWKNYEYSNGKIIAKGVNDGDEKGVDREVEYLVSSKNDKIVKINKLNGNQVKIQIGERKNIADLSEKEQKKGKYKKNSIGDYEGEILYISGAKEYTINLNQLDDYINEYELHPNWQTGKVIKKASPEKEKQEMHNKLSSKIFSLSSIAEVIAGGKMLINSIEETLKKGNEIHSAKAALAMGKFLPAELKQELQIKVERAESEAMDKELESLGKVDSRIAVKRIKSWLLNKDCAEHKKEAGLLFMLEKYGHLTSKAALYEYRGKYLWYEAFGGKIGDEFYNKIKKESEDDNVTFSEEYLMHRLLKKQCGGIGFYGHKRRSRLHKEFEGKWAAGIEAEFEKGYKDASAKRTARTMVQEGLIAEAAGGTTSNAIGWFKKAIERGGSLEDMSEGFFCLLYSGAMYDVDQKTFMRIKGLFDSGMPIMMMRFCTKQSEMELFNKTVLELSKRMGETYGGDIYTDAEKLFEDARLKRGSENSRIINTQHFWKKYGTQLARALNMVNTDDPTYSKTDNIIFLEKDNNPIFNDYYNLLKAYVDEQKFEKDFMDEECGESGLTGLGIGKLTKKYLKLQNTKQLAESKTGPRIWKEIIADLSSINKKTLYTGKDDTDGSKDKALKRKYLLSFLKELSWGFMSVATDNILETYNSPATDIGKMLNAIGLHLYNDLGSFSPGDVLNTDVADKILLKSVDKILNGALDGGVKSDSFIDPLDEIKGTVKKGSSNIISDGTFDMGI